MQLLIMAHGNEPLAKNKRSGQKEVDCPFGQESHEWRSNHCEKRTRQIECVVPIIIIIIIIVNRARHCAASNNRFRFEIFGPSGHIVVATAPPTLPTWFGREWKIWFDTPLTPLGKE